MPSHFILAAAREITNRLEDGLVLAIDWSEKSIQIAKNSSMNWISSGKLKFRKVAIENFELKKDEKPFDLAFTMRDGALDGRQPKVGQVALRRIKMSLTKEDKQLLGTLHHWFRQSEKCLRRRF